MYYYFALVIFLALPMSAQIHRGNAGTCFSNFHNFHCVPIDGGAVYAWDMNNPGQTDCISHQVPNNATFTGSGVSGLSCGGGTAPTITSTGLNIVSTGGPNFAQVQTTIPNFPNGWSISVAFNSSNLTGELFTNFNYPSSSAVQYSAYADGHLLLGYTSNTFQSSSIFNTANVWQVNTVAYKSATAGSAALWFNKTPVAGTWVSGTGTSALPSVQAETDLGSLHGNDNQLVGTIGYVVAHDHRINSSAQPFIYNAIYRAMQFRGVAIP
jgi:hypothetical protein